MQIVNEEKNSNIYIDGKDSGIFSNVTNYSAKAVEKSITTDAYEPENTTVDSNFEDMYYAKNDTNKTSKKDLKDKVKIQDEATQAREKLKKLTNEITPEGEDRLNQLGIDTSYEDIDGIVTVYDRIQARLAANCEDYKVTGLGLDENAVSMVANTTVANVENRLEYKLEERFVPATRDNIADLDSAVSMADSLTDKEAIDDNSKEYLLRNELEPTINNVYLASYSAAKDNTRQITGISEEAYSELLPQAQKALEQAGVVLDEGSDEQIKWLIDHSIPVTKDNYEGLKLINEVSDAMGNVNYTKENIINAIISSMSKGIEAKDTILTNEELSLHMDIEKAADIEKTGLNVDVEARFDRLMELNKLAKELAKDIFKIFAQVDEPTEKQLNIYNEVQDAKYEIANLNTGTYSDILDNKISYTVEAVSKESKLSEYEKSETQVRRDLGDSYNKAFTNSVDSLLENMDMELNDTNRQAVRICTYNNIPVNTNNVNRINEINSQLDELIENLTPVNTARLLAKDINPLEMDIIELNTTIETMVAEDKDTTNQAKKLQKYSEFLYELDKNEGISEEQRQQFIEVYKTINLVEKADRGAVGAMYRLGGDYTMKNLNSMINTKRHQNMDVKVEKDFGFLEKAEELTNSSKVSEEVLDYVLGSEEKASTANIVAAEYMSTNGFGMYLTLKKGNKGAKDGESKEKDVEEALMALEEDFTDENAYEKLEKAVNEATDEQIITNNPKQLDINALKNINLATGLMTAQSKRGNYQVPVTINGERYNMNIKVEQYETQGDEIYAGSVAIDITTKQLGHISANYVVENNQIDTVILADNENGVKIISNQISSLELSLRELGLEVKSLVVNVHKDIKEGMWKDQKRITDTKTQSKVLLDVAKNMINQIKNWSQE